MPPPPMPIEKPGLDFFFSRAVALTRLDGLSAFLLRLDGFSAFGLGSLELSTSAASDSSSSASDASIAALRAASEMQSPDVA